MYYVPPKIICTIENYYKCFLVFLLKKNQITNNTAMFPFNAGWKEGNRFFDNRTVGGV